MLSFINFFYNKRRFEKALTFKWSRFEKILRKLEEIVFFFYNFFKFLRPSITKVVCNNVWYLLSTQAWSIFAYFKNEPPLCSTISVANGEREPN
jgi:hypothetical protein